MFAMALGLAACSTDETDLVNGGSGSGEVETRYLSVNIMSANGGMGTRADNNYQTDYTDGTPDEHTVNQILFYFFDEVGEPVVVNYATGASYYLYNVPTDGFTEGNGSTPNVEKIREATIIIQTKEQAAVPVKTLVIINPISLPSTSVDNKKLSTLLAEVNEGGLSTLIGTGEYEKKKFVMSNAVYTEDGATAVTAVKIQDNIEQSDVAAKANPVKIYVERVVAKLSVTSSLSPVSSGQSGILYDTTKKYTDASGAEQPIYVRFENWNATAAVTKSYMVKHINPAWPGAVNNITEDTGLFKTAGQPWNYKDFSRSFWAINPTLASTDYAYGAYSATIAGNAPQTSFSSDAKAVIYLQENAASESQNYTEKPTQVIIAATLVNGSGVSLELAEFAGQRFVDEYNATESLSYPNVKKYILSALSPRYVYYDASGSGDEVEKYKEISAEDIKIVSATVAGKASQSEDGRYFVYAVLTDDAKAKTWYDALPTADDLQNGGEDWKTEHKVADVKTIDNSLTDIGSTKIWKSGMTYYYFDIQHLAKPTPPTDPETETNKSLWEAYRNTPGFRGVVRNHYYDCNINTLVGLGTPVYDPNETIYPEKPNETEYFIAAEINILSWRVVNHDYPLNW